MSCRGLLCVCGVFAVAVFFFRSPVVAAFSFKVDVVEPLSFFSKEQEVKVVLSIVGLPSESYFRAAFQKEGSDAYMGYLKNERGEWVKIKSLGTTECMDYFKLSNTSATQAALLVKLGEDTETVSGSYRVKAHRYTSTCKSYSESTESGSYNILLTLPSSTPLPTSVPTNTPTSTPQPTQTPAQSNTPIPTKKQTPTPYPTKQIVSDILGIYNVASEDADIPGLPGSDVVKISTPSGNTMRPVVFSLLFIGTGTGLLSVALALQKTDLWKTHIDQQRHHI